jgi:serine phosphatase RsbU (regulator of sigma subunit)
MNVDRQLERVTDRELLAVCSDLAALSRRFVDSCDYASVTVGLGDRLFSPAATADAAMDTDQAQYVTGEGPCLEALATGDAIIVDNLVTDGRWPRFQAAAAPTGTLSSLSVPIVREAPVRASLNLYASRPGAFHPDDAAALETFAQHAGRTLTYLRAWRAETVAHADDRRIAAALQRSLLPTLPHIPRLSVASRYSANDVGTVGGDWYDVMQLPDGPVGITIGDVMGHDLAAAARMGQLRSVMRAYAWEGTGPAVVLDRVDMLLQGLDDSALATAVFARLVLDGDVALLRYSCAGHPPPIVAHADGSTVVLDGGRSALLGVPLPTDERRSESTAVLPSGSTVVFYTDGLVEHRTRALDDGIAALREVIAAGIDDCPDDLCGRILEQMSDGQQDDDIALLVMRLT